VLRFAREGDFRFMIDGLLELATDQSLRLTSNFRIARDTIRIIETPRYVPYWNGRSDGKSRPARERGRAALPHEARASARQPQRLVRPQRAH